jgi:hypothetical protein
MNAIVVLRLVHILAGVFWAGTMLFFVTFLEPSIREIGPDGGRVMQALMRRRYFTIMPVIAGLTVLSGIGLLERVSGTFQSAWMGSPQGIALSVGGIVSLVAFAIGVFLMRPAALRVGSLMQQASQTSQGPDREAIQAHIQRLRGRARTSARAVASLLAVAVVTMAVARYLG